MLPLETERLILRSFQDSDLEPFVAYRSDPDVARYQAWDAPFPKDAAVAFIDGMQQNVVAMPGDWRQVAIALKADRALIGDCAYHILTDNARQAEIGFTLARRYQGQGYATEAVSRLLAYLFAEMDLHRIVAICDVENVPSARLLERIGMRREGHFIENIWFKGRWGSEYLYAMLQREWLAPDGSRINSDDARRDQRR